MTTLDSTETILTLDEERVRQLLREFGSQNALAHHLGVPASTLKGQLRRRGIESPHPTAAAAKRSCARGAGRLTRADVENAMLPQNNCRVAQFRQLLDDEGRDALDYALAQDRRDLAASGVRDMLLAAGFPESDVPGVDAINSHRRGERPCRCKG